MRESLPHIVGLEPDGAESEGEEDATPQHSFTMCAARSAVAALTRPPSGLSDPTWSEVRQEARRVLADATDGRDKEFGSVSQSLQVAQLPLL